MHQQQTCSNFVFLISVEQMSLGVHWKDWCLILKLQYFAYLMQRADSLEKTLMLGKIEGRRRRGWDGWMASLNLWSWVWVSSGSWWWTGKLGVLQSMGSQTVGQDWATELNLTGHTASLHFLAFSFNRKGWETALDTTEYRQREIPLCRSTFFLLLLVRFKESIGDSGVIGKCVAAQRRIPESFCEQEPFSWQYTLNCDMSMK